MGWDEMTAKPIRGHGMYKIKWAILHLLTTKIMNNAADYTFTPTCIHSHYESHRYCGLLNPPLTLCNKNTETV